MQPDNIQPTVTNPVTQAIPTVQTTTPSSVPPLTPPPVVPTGSVQTNTQFVYAGLRDRFLAVFIDGLILSTISFVVNFVVGMVSALSGATPDPVFTIITIAISGLVWIVQIVYPIYFIGAKGQTLGKMIMKIKVIKEDTGEIPGYTTAFLRETVGKFVSGIVLGIGYFVAYKDPKKQAWHDKIAHTIVIKTNPQ